MSRSTPAHSPQRPIIQQQHHKRQRYQHRLGHETESEEGKGQGVVESPESGVESRNSRICPRPSTLDVRLLLRVARVGQQRQQREKGAQHVFALGNPGDGFHMQRMPGKQRGDERAGPQRPGQLEQQQQQQHGIRRVKQDIDTMLCPGVQSEQLAIQHVRKPRDRMPVAGVSGGESPLDAGPRQAVLDDAIIRDVILVVVNDKAIVRHRPVSQQRDEREQQSYGARTGHRRAEVLALESRAGVSRTGFLVFAILASATQAGHRVLCMRFCPRGKDGNGGLLFRPFLRREVGGQK